MARDALACSTPVAPRNVMLGKLCPGKVQSRLARKYRKIVDAATASPTYATKEHQEADQEQQQAAA